MSKGVTLMMIPTVKGVLTVALCGLVVASAAAQTPPAPQTPAPQPPQTARPAPATPAPVQQPPAPAPTAGAPDAQAAAGVPLPPGYIIGVQDVLNVNFWREKEMSGDVVVRPDGKISLPLLNDIQAAGLTPDQLREQLVKAATKFVADANATVVVREIHSRNVYITGQVAKPSTYSLTGDMNVLQLIALAGGLLEYADSKNIVIMRQENGKTQYYKFNYKDVVKQKDVKQNLVLKPGDTVIVP
jgi:polysaccharide export outer membrane protein